MISALIVEDNGASRESLKQILFGGYRHVRVEEAATGKQALQAVEKSVPDVIFINIRLPDINGIELVRRLRRQSSRVIIIILSDDDAPEYRDVSLSSGADYFISPWSSSPEEIDSLLQTVFFRARAMANERHTHSR